MKVLVIGASGFVGTYLKDHYKCQGTSTSGGNGDYRFDLLEPHRFESIISKDEPDLIINSSGMTNVDACEREPEKSMIVNGDSVGIISGIAAEHGARFVQISTDYVFGGERGNYSETDAPGPINAYGKSKLRGEEKADPDAIILRISTPFGIGVPGGKTTFIDFVRNSLSEGKEVRAVIDQFTTPTYVKDIPKSIDALIEAGVSGIFHLGVPERISRHDFSLKIAELFGLQKSLIRKAELEDFNFLAKRPSDTSMKITKISRYYRPESIDSSLMEIRGQLGF